MGAAEERRRRLRRRDARRSEAGDDAVASKSRVIAEGAGALGVAAALKEKRMARGRGRFRRNIDLKKFCEIVTA
jgi:threonine dehydratase